MSNEYPEKDSTVPSINGTIEDRVFQISNKIKTCEHTYLSGNGFYSRPKPGDRCLKCNYPYLPETYKLK